ncbi:AraC family transcriptional regulator [Sphingobium sp. BYY-5]|uniref:AraC family transcriptional regulator n=1 Tax=Sphingobium sp. BYY-5 TaxID=2926400 RepID=UPI001FA74A60|nr:AraC family transcriptional regulator [Sphingobium sp. BYY-5]MCI4592181.1 AraC family transcriptional regulator [Sphingobium sp. BYY-5]
MPPSPPETCVPAALLDSVRAHVDALGGGEGLFPLPMNGVNVIRAMRHVPANPQLYKPSLCIVLEGLKQIEFGGQSLEYGVMECLIVNMEIAATGSIVGASPQEPFLGMIVELDIDLLRSVLEQLPNTPAPKGHEGPSLFVTRVGDHLADCLVRLVRMAQTPQAIPILFPSVMREISYWLLTGPHGGEICKLVMPETHLERITRAIRLMRENFAQTLRIEQLADVARMSPSSFHQHFKALTLMTPVQFQKQLRLLEARRLMIADAANVTEAAYQVGYESASQFSREYSRAFGMAPKRDVMERKALLVEVGAA